MGSIKEIYFFDDIIKINYFKNLKLTKNRIKVI